MSELAERECHYNAMVSNIRLVHEGLMVMRILPDGGVPAFLPGQYATLGLGAWEPRCDGEPSTSCRHEHTGQQLIRRAYSVSCPMLDDSGQLVTCADLDYLEFYIALVSQSDEERLRLTPRLFHLRQGNRICLSPHLHGTYTLAGFDAQDTILFLATGTGEAPHNAMIAQLLKQGHTGKILSAICVRHQADLGYINVHRELERRYMNYRYTPLTTREPENLDVSHPYYVGKQYLQDYVREGKVERDLGSPLFPLHTHVFLCGNPDMIGLPQFSASGEEHQAPAGGMVDILTSLGFVLDHPHKQGNIHVERYW